MNATLTYFQGEMLRQIARFGSANAAQICLSMAGKLEKNIVYQNSTIMSNLDELVENGFLATEERAEGDLAVLVRYYKLTDLGSEFIRSTRF